MASESGSDAGGTKTLAGNCVFATCCRLELVDCQCQLRTDRGAAGMGGDLDPTSSASTRVSQVSHASSCVPPAHRLFAIDHDDQSHGQQQGFITSRSLYGPPRTHPHLFGRPSIRISHTTLTFMCSGFHMAGGVWAMATLGGWCALVRRPFGSLKSVAPGFLLAHGSIPLEWLRPTPCPVSVQFLTTAFLRGRIFY